MALRGSFKETEPEDVLQILAMGGKTGVLRVVDSAHTTELVFDRGRIVDAFDGLARGEDAIFAMLARRSGSFVFTVQDIASTRTVDRDVSSILLAAAQRLDGLAYARKLLAQPTARPYVVEGIVAEPSELTEADRRVLSLVDGKMTLGEVASGSGLRWEEAYAALGHLLEQGIVELAKAESETSPLTGGAEASADGPAQAAAGPGISETPPSPADLQEVAMYLRGLRQQTVHGSGGQGER